MIILQCFDFEPFASHSFKGLDRRTRSAERGNAGDIQRDRKGTDFGFIQHRTFAARRIDHELYASIAEKIGDIRPAVGNF